MCLQENLLKNGEVMRGEAISIDANQKFVTLDSGKTVPYNYVSITLPTTPTHHTSFLEHVFCRTLPIAW
jgi:hypothetical protein